MGFRLALHARDVTLLPETKPLPAPQAAPERTFVIEHDETGYRLSFDGRRATVPDPVAHDLLIKVGEGSRTDWQYSSDTDMRATFRPLDRILQAMNSTPAYQLFLAGFHVGDSIGIFDLPHVDDESLRDSFRYLVGPLSATRGKKGRLFFLPEGYVGTPQIELELMSNGKLFSALFFTLDADGEHPEGKKVFVPYATPIGFNTQISDDGKAAWMRISDLVSKQSGGYGS